MRHEKTAMNSTGLINDRVIARVLRWICTLLLAAPLSLVWAADTDLAIRAVEVTGFGIVETQESGRRLRASNSRSGVDFIDGNRIREYTSVIPAEPGLAFGFRYIIRSAPKGRPVTVRNVIRFPEPGLVMPSGEIIRESRETVRAELGVENFYGFGFDEPWEMVPGTWTFEVWLNDARIVNRRFEVVSAADPSSAGSSDDSAQGDP
ncbi:MAG: DUF3859 domain-containing protein [Pseudomonadales bacterium]|nr:DUF3859 domain-containing protein [Pseudomonadales bacterium]